VKFFGGLARAPRQRAQTILDDHGRVRQDAHDVYSYTVNQSPWVDVILVCVMISTHP
jgi:hypothetical protein